LNAESHDKGCHETVMECCAALSGLVGLNVRLSPGDARGWYVVPHTGRKTAAVIVHSSVVVRVMAFIPVRCSLAHRRRFPVLRPVGAETNQPRATPEEQR
jgi:hypothetical protein